jgi:hypothetical protein
MSQDDQSGAVSDSTQQNADQAHDVHGAGDVVEVLGAVADILGEVLEGTAFAGAATGVAMLGMFLDSVGTVVTAAAQAITADNFFNALAPAQQYIFDYCIAYSSVVQGGPAMTSSDGMRAGSELGSRVLARLNDDQRAAAQQANYATLYQQAFAHIRQPTIDRLIELQHSRIFGDAVPGGDDWATAVVDAVTSGPPSGTAFQNFWQQVMGSN